MARVVERLGLQPAGVRLRPPAPPRPVHPLVTQQERAQALAHPQLDPLQVFACPDQVAHRLLLRIRHPHRRQLARAVQTRQHQRVPPVGLHPVAGPPRDQARRHHHTGMPQRRQLPVKPVPARTRLVTEAQPLAVPAQLAHQPPPRGPFVPDRPPVVRGRGAALPASAGEHSGDPGRRASRFRQSTQQPCHPSGSYGRAW